MAPVFTIQLYVRVPENSERQLTKLNNLLHRIPSIKWKYENATVEKNDARVAISRQGILQVHQNQPQEHRQG